MFIKLTEFRKSIAVNLGEQHYKSVMTLCEV